MAGHGTGTVAMPAPAIHWLYPGDTAPPLAPWPLRHRGASVQWRAESPAPCVRQGRPAGDAHTAESELAEVGDLLVPQRLRVGEAANTTQHNTPLDQSLLIRRPIPATGNGRLFRSHGPATCPCRKNSTLPSMGPATTAAGGCAQLSAAQKQTIAWRPGPHCPAAQPRTTYEIETRNR